MKLGLIWVAIGIVLGLGIEGGLRLGFGFGTPLLYQADDDIGYVLVPNQRLRRFGNTIWINEYSLRNGPISPRPAATTWRVMLVGDSVVNGSWWTDQSAILSEKLRADLTGAIAPSPLTQVEVLNASANSWGPRNERAYLEKFGSFGARLIVLLINTDDLFARAPSSRRVGRDPNFPSRRPFSAITEVWSRYVMRPTPDPAGYAEPPETGDRVGKNLEAIDAIRAIAQQHNASFLLAITPLRRELQHTRDYEQVARQRLHDLAQTRQIPLIDFLPIFQASPQPERLFQDSIHLSAMGNARVSHHLAAAIEKQALGAIASGTRDEVNSAIDAPDDPRY